MNPFKNVMKQFDGETPAEHIAWYRKNGMTALMWCVLSWVGAFVIPDQMPLFTFAWFLLATGGGIMLVIGCGCLFTWFTWRNDPDFK